MWEGSCVCGSRGCVLGSGEGSGEGGKVCVGVVRVCVCVGGAGEGGLCEGSGEGRGVVYGSGGCVWEW